MPYRHINSGALVKNIEQGISNGEVRNAGSLSMQVHMLYPCLLHAGIRGLKKRIFLDGEVVEIRGKF